MQSFDTRHRLAEIEPKPDQMTIAIGSTLADLTAIHPLDDSLIGTHLAAPDHVSRHGQHGCRLDAGLLPGEHQAAGCARIQPYFALLHVHGLELVERLIRRGFYMGPMNGFYSIGGGGVCGANPFDLMELIRRSPHGSVFVYQTTFRLTHPVRPSASPWASTPAPASRTISGPTKGVRMSTVEKIEPMLRMARELGRAIATPEQARQMLKIGVTYSSTAETLANLGLPPNRKEGHLGFLVHETDGRLPEQAPAGGWPRAGDLASFAGESGFDRAHSDRDVGRPLGATARRRGKRPVGRIGDNPASRLGPGLGGDGPR